MHSLHDVDFVDILRALLFVVNDAVLHVHSLASVPALEVRLETRDDTCIHWLQERCGARLKHLDLHVAEMLLGAMRRSVVQEQQDVTAFFLHALMSS